MIVEWFNVTNGYDTDVLWLYQKEFLIREGYAWVGVSAQNVGVARPPNGLRVWSPGRYGTLDVDGGGKVTGDALAYDIYSQAAAAVRGVPAVLGGLRFGQVIAAGQSQSAGRLATYFNGIHDRAPIYDAALLTVNTTPIRAEVSVPVIKVLSENEAATSRNQEDSAKIRTWTVAGSTHSEQYSLISRAAFLRRDLNLQAVDACETPARSRVEIRYVYNAAVDALVKWKKSQVAPPSAPPLTFADNVLQRDEHGNASGGIRLAEIAVPVARESAGACGLGGTHVPFEPQRSTVCIGATPITSTRCAPRPRRSSRPGSSSRPTRHRRSTRHADRFTAANSRAVRSAPTCASFRATRRRCCSRSRRPHCSSKTATRSCGCSTR